jgi:hypothetical protein
MSARRLGKPVEIIAGHLSLAFPERLEIGAEHVGQGIGIGLDLCGRSQTFGEVLLVADNADDSPDYLARVRTPANGYMSTPFAEDVELSLRIG